MDSEKREVWYLVDADAVVTNIHPERWCSGRCVVHRPSNHSMREMPLGFNFKLKSFTRTCSHGEEHWDPDERFYWLYQLENSHKTRGTKMDLIAMERLSDWYCPNCECGCCEKG